MRVRDQASSLRFRASTIDPVHVGLFFGVALTIPLVAAVATLRPAQTLLALAVLLVVGVTLLRTDIAVLLLIATGPLESYFSPGGFPLTKVAGGLAFASFALYVVRGHRKLLLEPLQAVVLGILGIALLSASLARDLPSAITTTTRYASFVALYIVISQLELTSSLQRRIAWVLGSAATLSAILGMEQYFSGAQPIATLEYAQANDFAFMLATSVPLMFWLLGGDRRLRPLVLGMIGTVFAAILLSLSRGALVGLAAGFVFLIATDRRRLQLALLGGTLAVFAAVLVIQSNPARFQEALSLKQHVAQTNVTTRFQAWSIAGRLAADHPALGVGPGNFRDRFAEMSGDPAHAPGLAVAHDAYLDMAAELGVPAGLLFLVYLGISFRRLTVANRDGVGLPGFAQAVRVSLVVALVCSVFLSEQYYVPFWLIGALGTGLWAMSRRADQAAPA